jgi:hypothetical protein
MNIYILRPNNNLVYVCEMVFWRVVWDILYVIYFHLTCVKMKKKNNSVAVVRKRTIPTERPPLVGEVGANLCG